MKLVVFGLSVTSTWGNGHGTTYRALLRALHRRGHQITFFEKGVEWYASNRDLPDPDFCRLGLYESWAEILPAVRAELCDADVAIVGSYFPDGIAAIDEMLDSPAGVKAFYDIDTPITMAGLREQGQCDYIAARQIPVLDLYFSFTGGPILTEIQQRFGAQRARPLYCSVDLEPYHRRGLNREFACDMSYMGTYAADRQSKLENLLCRPARDLADSRFIVAGPQYPASVVWPPNVRHISHLGSQWHAEFYSSSRLTLNLTRREMAIAGYSPSVRLFEAAACGAAMVSDNWPGLDQFFSPGKEILLAASAEEIVRYVRELSDDDVRRIGESAHARVLAEHSSSHRASEFERAVEFRLSVPQLVSSPQWSTSMPQ